MKPNDIDKYIAGFPAETQKVLEQLRDAIIKVVPEAEQMISYQVPAFKFRGMLVYFAAYEHHIGFYPTPSGIEKFREELSLFKTAKGSVQFPLDKPLPFSLITKIVKFRKNENTEKAALKLKKK